MVELRRFPVLNHFQQAVEECQAFTRNRGSLSLEDGMLRAVQILHRTHFNQGRVFLIGNGGSAAIASHQAVDLWKNTGIKAIAFNDPSLLTCIANDYGYSDVFARPLETFCTAGDCLIAISSSGQSRNILRGVETVRAKGGHILGLSGFDPDNPLSYMGDINFYVPSQSYGIVEAVHLLLVHAIVDELSLMTKRKHETRIAETNLYEPASHPSC